MTDHIDADERRSRPAYRAALWVLRLAMAVAVAYVIAMVTRAVPVVSGPSLVVFLLCYVVCLAGGYALSARAGMPIFALWPFGDAREVRANRRIVWRDVWGAGRRAR